MASSLAILGDGPTPSASPAYPDSFTTATVMVLSTTLTSFASPTAPLYSITIGKGNAYNRDWVFGF
ncbi:hypothetical protein D3C83_212970 [compost metagenome]